VKRLPNVHPGEILREEFLGPLGMTAYHLAKQTRMPVTRVAAILNRRRRVTADTALRLSAFFGNSAEFWVGIQTEYDLREHRRTLEKELGKIRRLERASA
jgi:antitoxin HigA-1